MSADPHKTCPDHSASGIPAANGYHPEYGLTKREWFAGQAMAGNLASLNPGSIDREPNALRNLAEGWVAAADALIEALNEDEEGGQ